MNQKSVSKIDTHFYLDILTFDNFSNEWLILCCKIDKFVVYVTHFVCQDWHTLSVMIIKWTPASLSEITEKYPVEVVAGNSSLSWVVIECSTLY